MFYGDSDSEGAKHIHVTCCPVFRHFDDACILYTCGLLVMEHFFGLRFRETVTARGERQIMWLEVNCCVGVKFRNRFFPSLKRWDPKRIAMLALFETILFFSGLSTRVDALRLPAPLPRPPRVCLCCGLI